MCSNRDIIATSSPCNKFVPDTNEMSSLVEDEETFMALSRIVGSVEDSQLRKLGAILMREKQTRAQGYQMGQKVYVRYRGMARANYLSNFMSAYIMYADRDVIRITSQNAKHTMTYHGRARDAIYTPDQFDSLREKMIKRGNFTDPDVQKHVSKHLRCLEEYELGLSDQIDKGEIPTIDKVFRSEKPKKDKGMGSDLVSIVNAIESGVDLNAAKRGKKKKKATKSKRRNGVTTVDVS